MRADKDTVFPKQDAQRSKWLLCLGISFFALCVTYWPDGLSLFRYERIALSAGQEWRLATGHLVHVNTAHLLINLLGLWALAELLWHDLPVRHGWCLLATAMAGINLALWFLHPELAWYAGLSGVLHALWSGCALAGLWPKQVGRMQFIQSKRFRYTSLIGMLLLILKLAMEWLYGASTQTAQLIGAPVVTIAHLYGALAGLVYIIVWRIASTPRLKNNVPF